MAFELFVARRLYADNDGRKRISRPAIRIAMLGIIVGLAVMIVSLCVVLGFKRDISSKVIGFGSHVQVLSLTFDQNREMMPVLTTDSLERVICRTEGVRHVQRFVLKLGMLKTEDDFRGLTFKGVGEDYDMSFFQENLIDGRIPSFGASESSDSIIISKIVASELGVSVGDRIFSYFIGNGSARARKLTVAGIFQTNLSEYDRNFVLTDIYTMRKLNRWDCDMSSGFEVEIDDFSQLDMVTRQLVDKINHRVDEYGATYGAFSIKEIAPHTFSWLDVLDMNVLMILVLMICVSAFTVISGLLIVMLERINMIGMLKALGATNLSVRKIFMYFSVMLVGKGVVIGNIVGLSLCLVQKLFGVVKLDASVYYIESVPIEFNVWLILVVNVLTLCISAMVIFCSSFFVSISSPAKTIRFE
ncbi:MAG: ABC transporter permease [Bacteroides sp.]|nr:ABC transporter permease [Roseburia sp.]MCM1347279.1 ABC transporter permease [Bacteroides sp.]MCM1420059.1 ABC transporter permease [Bacteroides sp.]